MKPYESESESPVFEVVSSAFKNGHLNHENRKHLKSLLVTDVLTGNDLRVINRLFSAIRRCRLLTNDAPNPEN